MTFAAVEKTRREYELVNLGFRQFFRVGLGNQALRDRLCLDPLGVEPAPVIRDADDDVAALVICGETDQSVLGLADGTPLLWRFKAMIRRIAHHVGERILDQIQNLTVELGIGALHLEIDLLPELVGKITYDARQLLPGITDRLHARLHHAFLQFGGDVRQPLQRRFEFRFLVATHDFKQLVAGKHQLGNHGHQLFESVDCYTNRLIGGLARLIFLDGSIDGGRRELG